MSGKMKVVIVSMVLTLTAAKPIVLDRDPIEQIPSQERFWSHDGTGNYAFGYNEGHNRGGTFRREVGDRSGAKIGSYGIRDADGNIRIVSYVADHRGFRPDIQTNEPGVVDLDPASTTINKGAAVSLTKESDLHQIHGHYVFTHGQSMHPACCIILRKYIQQAMDALHDVHMVGKY